MSNLKKTALSVAIVGSFFTLQTLAAERIDVEQANALSDNNLNIQQILSGAGDNSYQQIIPEPVNTGRTQTPRRKDGFRYVQFFNGVEVYGVSLVAGPSADNTYNNVSGIYVNDIASDLDSVEPSISVEEALATALAQAPKTLVQTDIYNIESKLYVWLDDKDVAHLAWFISYVDTSVTPTRPHLFIDAHTGEVLDQWEGMTFANGTGPGGNARTGRYQFGPNGLYPAFEVTGSGSNCQLDSPNVVTWDMKHQKSGGSVHTFTCYENTAREVNQSYSALNDAHAFGQATFDMFKDWYNAAPITQKLKLRVHYDRDYENAFWDGQQMTFGDGKNTFHPLVSVGVVAHEVSHGFTQQNSNLRYENQSGGLNESFSDISAAAVSYYLTNTFSWKVGDKIKKNSGFMRSMDNPPADGRSIGHTRDYRSGMDVHLSSGVFNKAFYLLSTTTGWNIHQAFDVYVEANRTYWNANETFDSAGRGVYKAAKALGYCVDDVVASLDPVGVTNSGNKDGSGCGVVGNRAPTANFSYQANDLDVTFTDSSTDDKAVTSYAWNFGDNSTSAQQNPSHSYAADGSYTVSLTVSDVEGETNTKSTSISVEKGGTGTGCDGLTPWSISTSYVAGDLVSHKGSRYEGTWWSTGAAPDVFSNVWKNNGKCTGGGENQVPVANFSHSADELTVTFNDTSTDDKAVVSHSWNFGDGSSATTANAVHTYGSDGSYDVQLTVMDAEGESNTNTKTVSVAKGGTGACTAPAWNANTIYNNGDKASQEGKEYKANWWSKGESPKDNSGQWQVWSLIATCP
ncbi:MAG: M4 family metallopeptidase [Colwellia sp.]|nr:M4 family metallopeptidase [Colwellia sp.]